MDLLFEVLNIVHLLISFGLYENIPNKEEFYSLLLKFLEGPQIQFILEESMNQANGDKSFNKSMANNKSMNQGKIGEKEVKFIK